MVPWSFIGILMHLFAAEPHSTTRLLYLTYYHNRTILGTASSMVWDVHVLTAGQSWFVGLSCSPHLCVHCFIFPPSNGLAVWGWGQSLPALQCRFSLTIIKFIVLCESYLFALRLDMTIYLVLLNIVFTSFVNCLDILVCSVVFFTF